MTVPPAAAARAEDPFEVRLFLEEIVCNLCRFQHVAEDGVPPEAVRIDQEYFLGIPSAFADVRVQVPGRSPYFVEVDWGYDAERQVRSLARKYGVPAPDQGANKLVLVTDTHRHRNWVEIEARIRSLLRPGLDLEVWDEPRLLGLIRDRFEVTLDSISAQELLDVRDAIGAAEKRYAFGPDSRGDALEASLLWHLGFWRLRQLRDRGAGKRDMLPPAHYRGVAVLMADLAGFSAYVRDTPDERVVRNCLTSFYAKSRHQVINAGGMMYQFLGDAVIAMWGLPDKPDGYLRAALDCARSLVQIGNSVSIEWQRQIDRVQPTGGVHIGLTVGDVGIMSLRPSSRTHVGAVGDSINMAARLVNHAASSQIVVSNTFYQRLDPAWQAGFAEMEVVEAKNVGPIRAWLLDLAAQGGGAKGSTTPDKR
jgi:class 3 adenylate cyclase